MLHHRPTQHESPVIFRWISPLTAVPRADLSSGAILHTVIHKTLKIGDDFEAGQEVIESLWELRERLDKKLKLLLPKLPVNPLDELIDRLGGAKNVAEMTGRKHRIVKIGKKLRYDSRTDKHGEESGEPMSLHSYCLCPVRLCIASVLTSDFRVLSLSQHLRAKAVPGRQKARRGPERRQFDRYQSAGGPPSEEPAAPRAHHA